MLKYKSKIVAFLIILVLIAGCSKNEDPLPALEDQIGQMLLVGFRGTVLESNNHIISDLENFNLGGVILYEKDGPSQSRPRNIESKEQLKNLISKLKTHSKETLFVAIDQEGGIVNRLKTDYGFPPSVTAKYLGTLNNSDSTLYYASSIASTLQELGINMNFAPVVDLDINPESPAIGAYQRSFSDNPQTVIFHASIFIDEHRKRGILCSSKHFPGHGSASNDSHLGLTDITDTWNEVELEPYRLLIEDGKCDMIMSAHVFNRTLDPDYPATLSPKILTEILRKQLHFKGLIVSDAMEMGAISDHFGLEEAIEKSINAGCDLLLFSNNMNSYNPDIVPQTVQQIKKMVDEGKISKTRISESYKRIREAKEKIK